VPQLASCGGRDCDVIETSSVADDNQRRQRHVYDRNRRTGVAGQQARGWASYVAGEIHETTRVSDKALKPEYFKLPILEVDLNQTVLDSV
jgi:hypothetical protein